MTTTTSATGSITSLGIGSNGLDLNSIISGLMAAESQPLTILQKQASSINTQISAVGRINSLADTFGDKAAALASSTFWKQTVGSTSDGTVVTADTSSGNAVPGTYTVKTTQLAMSQTATASAVPTDASVIGSGSMTIQLGTWSGNSFTAKDGSSPVSITIDPSSDTLANIRDKINGAGAGVTASIITDATGARLSIRSTDTGESNGFKLTTAEDNDDGNPATGLSSLTYDPSQPNSQMALNQKAQNALANVNGIDIISASNTLKNVSDGLNLTLLKDNSTATVTVATDTASMNKAIGDFVSAYNSLNAELHNDTKYDPSVSNDQGTARVDGPLQGDPSILSFQNQLKGIFNTTSTTSSMYSRLSDIGITMQKDGSLSTDSTKLTAALANPDELKKLFSTQGTTPENTGIMVRFSNLTTQALGVDGVLATRNQGLQDQLSRNTRNQDDMQQHLDQTQARLTKQYQALDTTMAQMSALSSYVTQQVALMEK